MRKLVGQEKHDAQALKETFRIPKISNQASPRKILRAVLKTYARFRRREAIITELNGFVPGALTKRHYYRRSESMLRALTQTRREVAKSTAGRVAFTPACSQLGVPKNLSQLLLHSGLIPVIRVAQTRANYVALDELKKALKSEEVHQFVLGLPGKGLKGMRKRRLDILSQPPFV